MTAQTHLAVISKADQALLAKYEPMLANGPPTFAEEGDLIPVGDLLRLVEVINAALRPATGRQMAETIALIAGAWPYGHQRADAAALDIHARLLAEDLATFPADILTATVRDLRRTLKFAPAISELYEIASAKMNCRTDYLRVLEAHRRHHLRLDALTPHEREQLQSPLYLPPSHYAVQPITGGF
jgi:hypothetical protein